MLTAEGLPNLGRGRVYQAWVQRGDRILAGALFVVEPRREREPSRCRRS